MQAVQQFQHAVEELTSTWADQVTVENRAARLLQVAGMLLADHYGEKEGKIILHAMSSVVQDILPELVSPPRASVN
ncbi:MULTISPECIES: hypothetical protein [unclassified Mesorhizobium]|uniref:hypothetical protein n=1 Tax=unclassified Mesorhizobium TaxID=325217 RepID=UPI000FD953F4|nr:MULTISPECIES: hypothetical protein [unclassified Mesorhizobium]TGT64071.1 hypothetical protein EN809_035020 [Mesorhizobium sp. M2E.F.Ca.ET.166.01.1.1]TGV97046.1 hypothetical protein EN797_035145 [Mesorhizobium sp. M2E.F.Ca.ET.154.01.1.1]